MGKWILWTSAITLLFAIVITWEAERCETASQQHQSTTATNPLPNAVSDVSTSPNGDTDKQQPPNQAGGAEANADSFLCQILTPANLPTIYLVLIGAGGIIVAIATLKVLENQARAADRDMVRLNRAYLGVSGWGWTQPAPGIIEVSFNILNPGRTGARIEYVKFSFVSTTIEWNISRMLTPRESVRMAGRANLNTDSEEWALTKVKGRITYRDIFQKIRHRTFGIMLQRGAFIESWEDNDEEEWDKD